MELRLHQPLPGSTCRAASMGLAQTPAAPQHLDLPWLLAALPEEQQQGVRRPEAWASWGSDSGQRPTSRRELEG